MTTILTVWKCLNEKRRSVPRDAARAQKRDRVDILGPFQRLRMATIPVRACARRAPLFHQRAQSAGGDGIDKVAARRGRSAIRIRIADEAENLQRRVSSSTAPLTLKRVRLPFAPRKSRLLCRAG